jgi:tetratricopeptide (TPR) repeat protein
LVVARRSDSRSGDYSLTGDTVNTAARLRGLAGPREVVVGPPTWQQVSDYFEAEAGTPIAVKGKEQPLVPWRIVAERTVHRAGSRPLVGRVDETQQFGALLDACLGRQRGGVVVVRGDPGIGKSRLVAEFVNAARGRGLDCHHTSILDFGASTGHDAMRRLAQSLLGLAPDVDEASRSNAIDTFAAGPGAAQHAPFLYLLLDVTMPASMRALLSAIDVRVRQTSTLDALCELVRWHGLGPPLLLLVEDIHWADPWTLEQLGALAARVATQPLLLLMTTRFAGDPSVGEWRTALEDLPVHNIDLRPLSRDDALDLAMGATAMSEALLHSCVERAEGNPLFLEHLLLNAADVGAAGLPGSIHALIQARMDGLIPGDKHALQAAAVWGSCVPLAALRHMLGEPRFDASALIEQFLLRPDGDDLAFSHALIRDGAYSSLLHAERRVLHLAAAQWIEDRDLALAAEHYERAQDERAPDAYLRASEALTEKFKYTEALALVERGLPLAHAPPAQFRLLLARARLLLENARAAESIDAGRAALLVAQSGADRALALIEIVSAMRLLDRQAEGLALLDEAQPLAEQAGIALELSRLHHLRGNLLYAMNRATQCRQSHELALEFACQAGSVEAEAKALGGIGDAYYAQGRIRKAHEVFTRCVALARRHGLLRVEASYLTMLGVTSMFQMDIAGSLEASTTGIELVQRTSHRRAEAIAQYHRVVIDGWFRGNVQAALPHAERALEIARSMGNPVMEAFYWTGRAMLALRQGDKGAARTHTAKALAVAGENGLNFLGAHAFGLLANAEADRPARRKAMADGEEVLRHGTPIHNHFTFYDLAIQASLEDGQWDEAERYCALLDAYSVPEPFVWGQFVSCLGRALCRVGRGESDAALLAQLQHLRERAFDTQFFVYLGRLDAAMVRASGHN